ncbi:MAG TPA: RnfH family protein [Burkholderiaceae bacterium]|nr:RnfH family protein [Burkholderiaceae bacterium]
MKVQVVFARPDSVWQVDVQVPAGSTVRTALEASGYARQFPEQMAKDPAVGIYGQRCDPDRVLADGDRIEIYRSLTFDPMESRRRRAIHRKEARRNVVRATK